MAFNLTVLGCSSATPAYGRHPSAQILNVNERFFLIDCGEATQMQLRSYNFKIQKIDFIFISHLHGDHYLGLLGLLSTMHLFHREKELQLFAPAELMDIIKLQLDVSKTNLLFPLKFTALTDLPEAIIFEDKSITICSVPMNHRIPCWGFVFREKNKPLKIQKIAIAKYNITFADINRIKNGRDFISKEGCIIPNTEITEAPIAPVTFVYCADTLYDENIIPYVKYADLLYYEATFMEDLKKMAHEKYHATTIEAATFAQKSNAKKLLIGHYSARYEDFQPLILEAQSVFKNTVLAEEGTSYLIQ